VLEGVTLLKLAEAADRAAVAAEVRSAMGEVSGLEVRVGMPADAEAEVWDLLVVTRAGDPAALARVERAWAGLEPWLSERVVVRKGWTFRILG
jgi:hypothetical protein